MNEKQMSGLMTITKEVLKLFSGDVKRFTTLKKKFKTTVKDAVLKNELMSVNFEEDLSKLNDELSIALVWANKNSRSKKNTVFIEDLTNKYNKISKNEDIVLEKAPAKKPAAKKAPAKKPAAKKAPAKKPAAKKASTETDTDIMITVKKYVNKLSDVEIDDGIQKIINSFKNDKRLSVTIKNILDAGKNKKSNLILLLDTAFRRKPSRTDLKELYKHSGLIITVKAPAKKPAAKKPAAKKPAAKKPAAKKPAAKSVLVNYIGRKYDAIKLFDMNAQGRITSKQLEAFDEIKLIGPQLEEMKQMLKIKPTLENEVIIISKNLHNLIVSGNIILGLLKTITFDKKVTELFKDVLKEYDSDINTPNDIMGYQNKITFGNKADLYLLNRKLLWAYLNYAIGTFTSVKNNNLLALFGYPYMIPYYNFINGVEIAPLENVTKDTLDYTVSSQNISFVFKNERFTISVSNVNYAAIKNAVIENDLVTLNDLVASKEKLEEELTEKFKKFDDGEIDIKIVDKKILCNGILFGGAQAEALLKYINEENINKAKMFKRFLYNLSLNPETRAQDELYNFISVNKLAITPAGTILLYKWVRNDYKDSHSGTFDNSPGKTVWMSRNNVNTDKNQTCSRGLHLCSFGYTKFSERLLLVELHPRDCVSIPSDYNSSKMRCCEYKVLMDATEFYPAMVKHGDFLSRSTEIHFNPVIIEKQLMSMYPNIKRINTINPKLKNLDFNEAEIKDLYNFSVEVIEERIEVDGEEDIEAPRESEVSKDENQIIKPIINQPTIKLNPKKLEDKRIKVIELTDKEIKDMTTEWFELHIGKRPIHNCSLLLDPNVFVYVIKNSVNLGFDNIVINESIKSIIKLDINEDNVYDKVNTKILNIDNFDKVKIYDILKTILSLSKSTSVINKDAEYTKNKEEDTGIIDSENHEANGLFNKVGNLFKKIF